MAKCRRVLITSGLTRTLASASGGMDKDKLREQQSRKRRAVNDRAIHALFTRSCVRRLWRRLRQGLLEFFERFASFDCSRRKRSTFLKVGENGQSLPHGLGRLSSVALFFQCHVN